MQPSLDNLARATGRDPDELAHLLVCNVCTPGHQCDENPALVRAAIAAYRGRRAPAPAYVPDYEDEDEDQEYGRHGRPDPDALAAFKAARQKSTVLNRREEIDPRKG